MMIMTTVIRLLIGFTLLIAGLAKALMNGDRFYKTVVAYDLLPSWIAKLLAKWLPWLELAVGAMLIFGIWTKLVAAVSMGILGIFAIAVCVSLLRNQDINCGCFGRISEKVGWRVVIRNIVLLILSLLVYTHNGGVATMDAWLSQYSGTAYWSLSLLGFTVTLLATGSVMVAGVVWKSQRLKHDQQSSRVL